MAIVTRKEFAELCGKSTNYINTYITRNQISVIPPDGKLIDTENPLNILFKKKCKSIERNKTEEERKTRKETKQSSSDFEKLIGKAAENLGMNQEVIDKIYTKPETPATSAAIVGRFKIFPPEASKASIISCFCGSLNPFT